MIYVCVCRSIYYLYTTTTVHGAAHRAGPCSKELSLIFNKGEQQGQGIGELARAEQEHAQSVTGLVCNQTTSTLAKISQKRFAWRQDLK